MLERATACFESAGRRLFRDSNDAIRSRRSLGRSFWKHNPTTEDFPNWFLALVQPSCRRPSSALNLASRNQTAHDGETPFLEFLCPRASSPALRISRHPRRLGLRRRRRTLVGFPRTYSSEAAAPNTESIIPDTSKTHEMTLGGELEDPASQAMAELSKSLKGNSKTKDFDKLWVLYLAAGEPPAVRSTLCKHLAHSRQSSDYHRAWEIFERMPPEDRSPSNFLYITRSQIKLEDCSRLMEIARLATTPEAANMSIPTIFAYFWRREMWENAVKIWELGSDLGESIFSYLTATSALWGGVKFARYLLKHPDQSNGSSSRGLARVLLNHISQSPTQPEHAPLDALLEILKVYADIGLVTLQHYNSIINTLQLSSTRAGFSRSIIFYRQLRWKLPDDKPSFSLIERQLGCLNRHGMTRGVLFFLNELAHLYQRPSESAYLQTLDCLANAGDVSNVETVFNRMRVDHGEPFSPRRVIPLLIVHATNGNVKETLRQFQRLTDEFGIQPNTYCWNVLLKAHATKNDWESAYTTFIEMLEYGVKPDSHTFGTLMGITAKRGDIDSTRRLLREAQKHHVLITAPILDTIVQVYCRNGHLKFAEELAEMCLSLHIEGSYTRMWNLILVQYARRIDVKSCYRIRERMEGAKIPSDAWTHSATMLGLVLAGRTDRARRMLRQLHKTRQLEVEESHYSLIMFGYAEEGNRDMVQTIFGEILERFGKAGPRPNLLYLRAQVQRDLQIATEEGITGGADLHLTYAERALAQSMADHDETSAALQYECLIKEYGTRGATGRASALYQQYLGSRHAGGDDHKPAPIGILTSMMAGHLHAADYKKAEELWSLALSEALEKASRFDFEIFRDPRISTRKPNHAANPTQGRFVTSQDSDAFSVNDRLAEKRPKVLPSQRFILAKPLSLYMRVLAYQDQTNKISELVANVEKLGFALTTFNWSTWVQMLASSDHFDEQLKAFVLFEEKFAPHFPGWYPLLHGLGRRSPEMPRTIGMLEEPHSESIANLVGKQARKHWLNIEPDLMQPTYLTVVFLAASLDRVRARTITQGNIELQKIDALAPQTVKMIGEMPYKRDKFQAVLIRHRSEQPDKEKKHLEHLFAPGGILNKGGKASRRGDIFLDNETLETRQAKFPKYLKMEGDHSPTEGSADAPPPHDGERVDAPQSPLSPADLIDAESEIRRSRHKQIRFRKMQFARVISREKKRRDDSKQGLKPANDQTLAGHEALTEEHQSVHEEQAGEEIPEQGKQGEQPEHREVEAPGNDEQTDVERVTVTETSSETPDENKARE